MKKLILTATMALLGGAASAAPGFVKAVFSGSAYNGTSDIWSYTKATVVENLDEIYAVRSDHPTTTTYAYGTYMQLEGGVEYYFAGQYDDYVTVKIDDAIVIPQGGNFGVVKFGETGWHKVELRFANNGGPGGVTSASLTYGGAWFKKGATGTYQKFVNNDAGNLYVTEAPDGYVAATPEYAFRYGTYNSGGTTYIQLIKCGGCVEDIAIPDQIDGYPVGQINDSCFNGNTTLKAIAHWPSQLMTIGGSAFYGCTALTAVEVPDTVTSLGGSAFRSCSALKAAKLPATIVNLNSYVLADCSAITNVTLPTALKSIQEHAFYNDTSLEHVEFPETLQYVGVRAFQYCRALKSVHHPDSVYYIGEAAYEYCDVLESVNIPDGITDLYAYTFQYDYKLNNIVIPDSVQSLGINIFRLCTSLTELVIPYAVTAIPDQMCGGCSSLVSAECKGNVLTIGSCAFADCVKLQAFDIPSTVTSIGGSAFYNCACITEIVLPTGLKSISDYMLSATAITAIDIPNTVTSIGDHAFYNCVKLKKLDIPPAVSSISSYAFYCCSGITEISIPEGVTALNVGTFAECKSLVRVDIPSTVKRIEADAFCNCPYLTNVVLPEGLTFIGYHAFCNCTRLSRIVIPETVTEFGIFRSYSTAPAFEGCSTLKSVVFNGKPPTNVGNSWLFNVPWHASRKYGAEWLKLSGINSFYGYDNGSIMVANVISSSIRENDPTIMDVVYKVTSKKPTVKVRVLAFEDGERSFAKVVRPETFVTDTNGVETACNVGDNVTPNVEHTISWRVSSDWTTKLAKVKFEVLACEGELLPLELMTIPASDQYGKMKISWNAISESQVLDALFWLYADKDSGLLLEDGKLKRASDGGILVRYDAVRFHNGKAIGYWYTDGLSHHESEYQAHAPEYVFNKMGYSLLTGAPLAYANSETRLGLSPQAHNLSTDPVARQYAYKIVEE